VIAEVTRRTVSAALRLKKAQPAAPVNTPLNNTGEYITGLL
jgi:hypothetical protein